MILSGKLIRLKREAKEFKGTKQKEKLHISLAEVNLTDEQKDKLKEAFKDSGKNFTPDWVLDFKGYVNLATEFELPARLPEVDGKREEVESIEDAVSKGFNAIGADVRVSINVKTGALYPSAMIFDSEGEPINAFAEFDAE